MARTGPAHIDWFYAELERRRSGGKIYPACLELDKERVGQQVFLVSLEQIAARLAAILELTTQDFASGAKQHVVSECHKRIRILQHGRALGAVNVFL
jgi:hypothetical protein